MTRVDEALLNRLGAYVDGELSAIDAAKVEEMIDQDVMIRQVVEGLKASTHVIRDDFLKQIEEEPIPDEWLRLIKADGGKSISARWPLIAGVALLSVVLVLCGLTYVNLIEIRELRHQLAMISNQAVVPLGDTHRQTAGGIARSIATAGDGDKAGDLSTEAKTDDLNQRLALAAASLEASSHPVDTSMETTTFALQQIEAMRAALIEASDPIQLITAEHHLLDGQAGGTLPMIGQVALEPILSEIWGQSFTVPNLEREGFVFKGGRLVAINDQPVAHLAYRNTDDQTLGVWMRPAGERWFSHTRDREDDLTLVTWSNASTAYLLIGALERSYLESIKGNIQR